MRKQFSTTKHFYKVLCCLLLIRNLSFCQTNLVPNPSFEQYTDCPDNSTSIQKLNGKPDIWYKPDFRGSVYFNRCSNNQPNDGVPYNLGGRGYQETKTGNGYMGVYYYNQNLNNYIQIKLYDSLKAGKKYYGEYYVNLVNYYLKGCNNISMLFTNSPIYVDTNSATYPYLLQANPQITSYGNPIVTDTMNWVKISGIFTAQGGEQYLTLGNFKLATQTQFTQIAPLGTGYNGAYYYIDDVAVYNLDSFCLKADAGKDTIINAGDSVFIGSYTNGIDSLLWLENGTTELDSTRPGFYVKPTANTYYVLHQVVNGCFSSDTINIIVKPLPLKFISFSIFPFLEGVRGSFTTATEINVSHYNIERSINAKDFEKVSTLKANNKNYNEYNFVDDLKAKDQAQKTLYYRITGIDKDGKKTYSTVKSILINHFNHSISIYPNPAKDYIYISSKENIQEIILFNTFGQLIKQIKVNSEKSIIDVKNLPNGIYLLNIVSKLNNNYYEKIIIQ